VIERPASFARSSTKQLIGRPKKPQKAAKITNM
jgi:hypothetical protein